MPKKNGDLLAVDILRELIACRSVTPDEGGALSVLEKHLAPLGFDVTRKRFGSPDTPDVENLYARAGTQKTPHLCFAGHTDVVPPGDVSAWKHDPFGAEVSDDIIYGRGAVDMKGGIACFLAALKNFLGEGENESFDGSISLLITGDEEGPAINGTKAILDWLVDEGEKWDACIVGEPTNRTVIGDTIKVGRRGSISGTLIVEGEQGHTAYPHLAKNPVPVMMEAIGKFLVPLDEGTERFEASNLQVTSVDTDNPATNVIPATIAAKFNIRFNDSWTDESLRNEIENRLKDLELPCRIEWVSNPSPVFVTDNEGLVGSLSDAIESVTGVTPELSTGGGTSDARFMKNVCPVVEFGLVGATMHQVDEHTSLSDLTTLTNIYEQFLRTWFAK